MKMTRIVLMLAVASAAIVAAFALPGSAKAEVPSSATYCVDSSTVTYTQPTAPDVVAEPNVHDYQVYGIYFDVIWPFVHFGWHFPSVAAHNAYNAAVANYNAYLDDLDAYNDAESQYEDTIDALDAAAGDGGYFEDGVPHTVTAGECPAPTETTTTTTTVETTPVVVEKPHDSGSFVCYSVGGTPKAEATAKAAESDLAAGNWLPVAIKGNAVGGENVGAYHLACQAPISGALPARWVDNNGDVLDSNSASSTGFVGVYPIVG